MKKLSIIALNLFVAASLLLTSCGKDDEKTGASVVLDSDGDYVASGEEVTVTPEAEVMVRMVVKKGDANMTQVEVRADGGLDLVSPTRLTWTGFADNQTIASAAISNPVILDGDDKDDFIAVLTIKVPASNAVSGFYTYSINITDKNGIVTTKSIKVKVSAATLSSYTAKLLGAQSAAEGSYLTYDGNVISQTNAAANASSIVLSFGQVGGSFTSKLISPLTADRTAEGLTKGVDGGNATYFKASSLSFDSVTASELEAISASSSKSIAVTLDGVYEFVSNGKKGIVKVTALSENGTDAKGSVTLSVKVLN